MNYETETHTILREARQKINDADWHRVVDLVSENVKVITTGRLRKAMGQASVKIVGPKGRGRVVPETLTLKLSKELMARATPEERTDTIIHELAHLIDFVIRGLSNHDHHWKQISILLGGTGARCHRVSTRGLGNTVTRWEWVGKTDGKVYRVKRKMHHRLLTTHHNCELVAELKIRDGQVVNRKEIQLERTPWFNRVRDAVSA